MESPKAFISYSWSSPEHENRVLELATELVNSGVQIILDKWDLKEGHDSIAFMESMVVDPSIKKVIIICDKVYADKANGRTGGVGTEAQIISSEIYRKAEQDKFVALVLEKDELGKAILPLYYTTRKYIDFSQPSEYSKGFTQLLRWIFDKPLYQKPAIGSPPSFVINENPIINSSLPFSQLCNAIKENSISRKGLIKEYLELITRDFEKFRISENEENLFDERVIESITDFVPYRNEFVELISLLSKYELDLDSIDEIQKFFETLIPFQNNQKVPGSFRKWDFDNYRFIIHELFISLIAVLLKYERFKTVANFLSRRYFFTSDTTESSMKHYSIFRHHLPSIKNRNTRLKLGRLSLHADLIKERTQLSGIDFNSIMQADFVLYIRGLLDSIRNKEGSLWWPETLVFMTHWPKPFEIFVRCETLAYFEKVKIIFGVQLKGDFKQVFDELSKENSNIPKWDYESINPKFLLNYDNLCKYN
ncbi:SEFIR domain-containing protein [Leptospira andrefontaineae]|uniref:SEFIR domain-containing protein n=1 Tax=Leptospira andrefontaineae TaxID=2484976 RepID=A0A4R9H6K9_9LEPT|nr:SEFIR domain-containing protein [Leptospira andrefontaineae]TGK41239.1 hypothetical protein EHO65_07355 [Leptospira andrefontaineae]